jgi:serine/threonine protein kinase/WD40 repeat protein
VGETPHCPDCGNPLTAEGWSEDLCPHCLLRLALQESSGAGTGNEEVTAQLDRGSLSRGRVLGNRYGIRKLLGRGGMGEVWCAFDLKLRVDVALKTVRPELFEQPRVLETLRQEVRAAREVVSANVCRVHDLLELEGRELVSMEYVDGTTLLQLLEERGPIALQEAREIAAQFLSGLDAIHRAGLVHRDIKPENLMITRTGRVVVMDFGIAKGLAAGRVGTVAGTPAYMAPEQARGEGVDARADVFSAGVVLAEMLAPASDREARTALWRGIRQEPPAVPESPWRGVIEVAVSPRREQRYPAASALARALEEVTIRVEGAEDVAPYPGLSAFSEANREYFFGRELEAEAVWNKIRRLHLLALIGPSGAGKTSFLQAGLLANAPAGWTHVICTPGPSPLTGLRQALAPHLSGDSDAIRELVKVEDPEAMVSAVSRWRKRSRHALLIVDQFEELFTLNPPEVQTGFASLLGRLAVDADLRILLSMRDDFLVQCHAHEALRPILSELTLLGPPSAAALRRAVVQPALKCGYRFEDEALVDRMLSAVEGERGALPLLAFAAEQLWQRRDRKQGVLTREAYELIGGVSGALAQHAELTLERIGTDRAPIVRELFRNLVTVEGTRAARAREELLSVFPAGGERRTAGEILDALIGARLLTSYGMEAEEGTEQRGQRIEIVHESLLAAWPRLVRWRAQDVEGARLRDDLRRAARRWQERDRPDDLLWTGSAYREYQIWRERYPGALSEIELAFAQAMATRDARVRRRRRLVVGGAFVLLAGVATAIGVSRQQAVKARGVAEAEARRAEASKVLALGRVELDRYPTAALAYARKSLEIADTAEARRFAVEALWQGPPARILPAIQLASERDATFSRGIMSVFVLSPDGRWLATTTLDGKMLLFSSEGGPARVLPRQVESMRGEGRAGVLAFGPDSDLLATGGRGASMRFWSVPELRELRTIRLGGVSNNRYAEHPWGPQLVTLTHLSEDAREELVRGWTTEGEARTLGTLSDPWPGCDIDPAGTRVACPRGRTVRVRRLDAPPSAERVVGELRDQVEKVLFFPKGDRLAARDRSGEIRVLSLAEGQERPQWILQGPGPHYVLFAIDAAGRRLARSDEGLSVRLWDLAGPRPAMPLLFKRQDAGTLDYGTFDPLGRWLIEGDGANVAFWPLSSLVVRRLVRSPSMIHNMLFGGDGQELLACNHGGAVHVVPLWSQDPAVQRLPAAGRWVALAAAPGRPDLVTGAVGGKVLHWDSPQAEPQVLQDRWEPFPGGPGGLLAQPLAIDREGRRAAALPCSFEVLDPAQIVLRVWDLPSRKESRYSLAHVGPQTFWFPALAFGDDGSFLVAWTGLGVVRLTLPADPAGTVTSETVYAARRCLFASTPDGRLLLIAASQQPRQEALLNLDELLLVDRESRSSHRITTHGARISALAIDAAGRVIVTGDAQGVVRVGLATGEEPHLLLDGSSAVTAVTLSRDGHFVASASEDGVRLWPMPDLTKPPLHTLPHDELIAKLHALTNLEVVVDPSSPTGYATKIGLFPGWEEVPSWW